MLKLMYSSFSSLKAKSNCVYLVSVRGWHMHASYMCSIYTVHGIHTKQFQ